MLKIGDIVEGTVTNNHLPNLLVLENETRKSYPYFSGLVIDKPTRAHSLGRFSEGCGLILYTKISEREII